MLDANADTDDEHAILEPGVGQTPLWDAIALNALFPHDADALLLLAALEAFDPALDWSRAAFRNVEDQDWERAWMDQYAPLRFGARTWIVPWNHELPAEADAPDAARSAEHTSELQSLMRTSYADFCLNKTTTHRPQSGREI